MERHLDVQLDKLRTRILKMCSLVDDQVNLVIKAVNEENIELAQQVVERDKKVDKYDLKIDKICQKIFALNQPVAMDLRLIMSALTMNTNLERIGDLAVNIAEHFMRLKKKPSYIARIKYQEMAETVKEMLKNAIDSFIQHDAKLAQEVIKTDEVVDKYNWENHDLLINIMKENMEYIDSAVELIEISRHLERIADHATNIAEDVYFIVEAQLIKHKYEKFIFDDESESDEADEQN